MITGAMGRRRRQMRRDLRVDMLRAVEVEARIGDDVGIGRLQPGVGHHLEHLLRLAAAAVSRLQSHQLASLEQSGMTEDGRLQTTWQLEIPMRHAHDIVPLQVKLQREDPPPREQQEKSAEQTVKQPLWRLDLAFDLEPLGPLQVQAQLLHGSLSGQLWAERPYTASLIENNLDSLRAHRGEHAGGFATDDAACCVTLAQPGHHTRMLRAERIEISPYFLSILRNKIIIVDLIRVRVGPFASKNAAEQNTAKVKALGLSAIVSSK